MSRQRHLAGRLRPSEAMARGAAGLPWERSTGSHDVAHHDMAHAGASRRWLQGSVFLSACSQRGCWLLSAAAPEMGGVRDDGSVFCDRKGAATRQLQERNFSKQVLEEVGIINCERETVIEDVLTSILKSFLRTLSAASCETLSLHKFTVLYFLS